MKTFTQKTFTIPELIGISKKNIDEHIKLYAGYVKNANAIIEKLSTIGKDPEANAYHIGELYRRFSFEYNGIRNHETYFLVLEGGASELPQTSNLRDAISLEWGSFENWLSSFKTLALTRGIGWAMLWYDKKEDRLLISWVDEQHLGQLSDCSPILGIDMWEHSYVYDYQPSGKKQYVEDFFKNLNWGVVEDRFNSAIK